MLLLEENPHRVEAIGERVDGGCEFFLAELYTLKPFAKLRRRRLLPRRPEQLGREAAVARERGHERLARPLAVLLPRNHPLAGCAELLRQPIMR